MLSLAGAGLGLVLASWGRTILLGFFNALPEGFRIDTTTDLNVLAFTLGTSVLTAVLFGLIPAFRAASVDPAAGLKDRAALSVRVCASGGSWSPCRSACPHCWWSEPAC